MGPLNIDMSVLPSPQYVAHFVRSHFKKIQGSPDWKLLKVRKLLGKINVGLGKPREVIVVFHHLSKMEDNLQFLTLELTWD